MNLNKKWMIVVLCLVCFVAGLSGSFLRTNDLSDKVIGGQYHDRFKTLKAERKSADKQYQAEHKKRLRAESQISSAKQSAKDAQSSADQRVASMTQLAGQIQANASTLKQKEMAIANKYYAKHSSSDVLIIPLSKVTWTRADIDDGGFFSSDEHENAKIVDTISLKDPYSGKSSTISYEDDGRVSSIDGAWGVIESIASSDNADDMLDLSRDGRLYNKTAQKIKVKDQQLDGQKINLLVSRPAGSDRNAPWVLQRVTFVYDKGGLDA